MSWLRNGGGDLESDTIRSERLRSLFPPARPDFGSFDTAHRDTGSRDTASLDVERFDHAKLNFDHSDIARPNSERFDFARLSSDRSDLAGRPARPDQVRLNSEGSDLGGRPARLDQVRLSSEGSDLGGRPDRVDQARLESGRFDLARLNSDRLDLAGLDSDRPGRASFDSKTFDRGLGFARLDHGSLDAERPARAGAAGTDDHFGLALPARAADSSQFSLGSPPPAKVTARPANTAARVPPAQPASWAARQPSSALVDESAWEVGHFDAPGIEVTDEAPTRAFRAASTTISRGELSTPSQRTRAAGTAEGADGLGLASRRSRAAGAAESTDDWGLASRASGTTEMASRQGELAFDSQPARSWWTRIADQVGDFARAHVLVILAISGLALLLGGYSVLRARAIPVADLPEGAAVAAPTGGPATAPTGPVEVSPGPPAATPPAATPSSENSTARTMMVHVAGAVRRPGVLTLNSEARVFQAIAKAGGLLPQAQPGALNLAQVLTDGQQVFISGDRRKPSEIRGPTATGPVPEPSANGSAGPPAGKINLNTATAGELETLPGVGPVTAAAILAWRQERGKFSRIEELQEVSGIGPKTYARLAPLVTV